ncbi:MAG: endoglucanase, partial [Candidatus Promineifilaceae bacterium]
METTFFAPENERFRYIGRFDFDNPEGPAFDWSASAVEFSFVGTAVAIHLADGRNSYNVVIDGRSQVLKTIKDREVYVLAEELEPGEHTFRISKRTEAYVGAAVFKGADITGTLLETQPEAVRRIEFIGDSITAGYGNEGGSPDCWFTPDTENAGMSYAAVTADSLDADYSLIALSGLGVVRNLRADTAVSEQTAVDFIDRALGL